MTSHGKLPAGTVLALAAGLAEGLHAIHAAGVVHRDLKPSNVLLADDGPRLIDFGISRAAEASSLTHTGAVVGSPGFMSPEQAEGHEVGPPSDIFSLGAVLTYAAAGEGPFGTGSSAALIYRVVHGQPSLADVPAQVRPLVERCLAKEVVDVYVPASALSTQMSAHIDTYFAIAYAPSVEPATPATLRLGAGDPTVSTPEEISADEYQFTLTFSFSSNSEAWRDAYRHCTLSMEAEDGIGLPGSGANGCGGVTLPQDSGYIG